MKNKDALVQFLEGLYSAHRSELGAFPWEYESDRWSEFVVCLWIGALHIDAARARDGVGRLVAIGWHKPSHWIVASAEKSEFARTALASSGFTEAESTAAVDIASTAANAVQKTYGDGLHLLLRRAGEEMLSELIKLFPNSKVERSRLQAASILWLQNVANIPILSKDEEHIVGFCRRFGIHSDQLVNICDNAGLNIAVLDDLLAAHHMTQKQLRGFAANTAKARKKSVAARGKNKK